jgi:murein DD-endopeptidase MepM/ murein hydrolase activator NlpD
MADPAEDTRTRQEATRLRQLERKAKREARRRAKLARRGDRALPHGVTTGGASEQPRGRLARRLRRGGLVGLSGVLILLFIVPPFLIPVDGEISSRFFIRNAPDSPRLFDYEQHTGLDFAAETGAPVIAARCGRVIEAGRDDRYGLYVDIRHALGWVTRYAHLSRIVVDEEDFVWRRRRIGAVGATGRVTGPHLHFEIRIAGRAWPPGWFLIFHRIRWGIWQAATRTS